MTKKPAAKGGAKDLTNKKSSTGSNFPLTKKAKWGGTENGAKEQKGKDFKNGAKKDFKKGAKNAKFQKKGPKKEPEEKKEPLNKKELKRERKKRDNPNYDTEMSLKKMWEILRNSENEKEKETNVNKILSKVKDEEKSLVDFAFAHDTTRVLQSCLQHGTKEQRRAIFEELKPRVPEMAKEKYAKNIIWKLIKYGDREMKDYCIENLGNVRNLVRSNIGQSVLEYAYNQFAQSAQRNKMIRMLYGKSFQRLSKMDKDMSVLDCCIKNANFVDSILTDFMEDLKSLTEKEVITQTVSHRAFLDFFNLCLFLLNSEDEQIKEKRTKITQIRAELIEQLRASVIHMIHTPDGARCGLHCIWFGSAKDRKLILKTIKEFIEKVLTAEYGHLLVLGTIDSVDDTVLVKKSIVSLLAKDLDKYMEDKIARKICYYLIGERDRRHFLPDVIKLLAVGDQTETSKKPRETKLSELQTSFIPEILEWFSENVEKCVSDASLCPMLVRLMKHDNHVMKGEENLLVTLQAAIAKKIAQPGYTTDENHPLAQKHFTMTLKQILSNDTERDEQFVKQIVEHCSSEMTNWLSDNRGCFLLLQCIEVNDAVSNKKIGTIIESEVQAKWDKIKETKGGSLLIEKAFDNKKKMKVTVEKFSKKFDEPMAKKKKTEAMEE